MIYLYVKTHQVTGLKYLGKTVSSDPHKYPGSGKYWRAHLEKHGYNYSTEILFESTVATAIKEKGIYYSRLWDIVKSDEWANLKDEQGDGGYCAAAFTPEANAKRSSTLTGRTITEEHRKKLSEALRGHKDFRSKETKERAAQKASAKLKGRKKPDGFGDAVSDRKRGTTMSDSAKANMRAAWSPERRADQAVRRSIQNARMPHIACPHCGLIGKNKGNMSRYHFDNCALIKPRLPKQRITSNRAKSFAVMSPDNEIFIVDNMRAFCREHNLNSGTMSEVALGNRKQHKGWVVTSVDRDGDSCS